MSEFLTHAVQLKDEEGPEFCRPPFKALRNHVWQGWVTHQSAESKSPIVPIPGQTPLGQHCISHRLRAAGADGDLLPPRGSELVDGHAFLGIRQRVAAPVEPDPVQEYP